MPDFEPQLETTTTDTATVETTGASGGESTQDSGGEDTSTEQAAEEGSGESTESEGTSGTQEYKPNLKFKADEKEYEIPKELAGLIKDEATEKRMVELLQKSYGLDAVKTRAESVRQQRDEFKTKLGSYDKAIERLRDHYNRGDVDMWLDEMKVDPNKMLKWALDKVNYSQLPPEQKAIRDAEVAAKRQAYDLQQKNVEYQGQAREAQVQAMQTAMNYEFGRPEVSDFQKQFDQKVGKTGAFFEAVKQKGQSAFTLSSGQKTMTPAEAVAAVMSDYKGFFQAAPGGMQTNPNAPKVVQPNQSKTTIPNTQGKQTSPVGQPKPKNLKELRELAAKAGS